MNQEELNELRSKLDIVSVIGEYIPLTKKGRNYFGLCPFHDDHSPSLSISSEKQIYKCFVCGESGNVFNFVMNYEHLSFPETISMLANKVGMNVNIATKKETTEFDKYYEIMDISNKFFQNNLSSKEGSLAREYLKKRNLDDDTIKEFGIGLSLNSRDFLINLLLKKGYSLEELNLIDLANTNHDTYINRIIFPLHNLQGKVIGFSGRIYDNSDLNKYQNTKETPIFKKRENLYNYFRAKDEIRKSKSVIVMEGFMAVIRSYTVGIKNCIATMGTALSNEQANLIKKLSPTIYLCYDGDNAGKKATLISGEEFMKLGVNPLIISLSNGLDPDDYIIKYGKESFQSLIDSAIPFSEYRLKALKSSLDLNNVDDKTKYVNRVLLEIKDERDEIKREIMLKNLASETDIWYNTLEKKLLELLSDDKKLVKTEDLIVRKSKKDGFQKAMEQIVYFMLNSPLAITLVDESGIYFPDKNIRLLINEIIAYYHRYGFINEADFYSYLADNKDLLDVLKKISSENTESDITEELIKSNLNAIKNYNRALEIKKLEELIKKETNFEEQMRLMERMRILKMKEGNHD